MKKPLLLIFVILLSNVFAYNLDDGLIAYYSFDNIENNILKDDSGNGHDGIIYGNPKVVDGVKGKALEFDGIDDYIIVPNSNDLNPKYEITISAWFVSKDTSKSGSSGDLLTKGQWYPGLRQIEFPIHHYPSDYMRFAINPDGGSLSWISTEYDWNIKQELNKWHHVVGVFDGRHLKLYLDGKLVSEKTLDKLTPINCPENPENLYIGGGKDYWGDIANKFKGIIDEIRIYNRALSDDEIKALYNSYFKGTLKINSNPPNADVYVDNKYVGKTPLTIELNKGTYTIKISKDGYDDYITKITAKSGETKSISANLVKIMDDKGEYVKPLIETAKNSIIFYTSRGYDESEAEKILKMAEEELKNKNYGLAEMYANKAYSYSIDIDHDGVENEKDFAPTINNNYIYFGAVIGGFALISGIYVVRKRIEDKKKKDEVIKELEEIIKK